MGKGIPVVPCGESLLLVALLSFFRRAIFFTNKAQVDFWRKRKRRGQWDRMKNPKAVGTISAQVVGLREISSMEGKQKGATKVKREDLISITGKNFGKEVIQSDLPVLIDFWAPWCSPCRTIGPVIEKIAKKYRGRIKVGKMNVAENLEVSSTLEIRSLPTLILFKDGKAVRKVAGAHPEIRLKAMIEDSTQSLERTGKKRRALGFTEEKLVLPEAAFRDNEET